MNPACEQDALQPPPLERLTICLASSHGGHLTELLELEEVFRGHDTFYFSYDGATTRLLPHAYLVPNQPYNPVRYLRNLALAYRLFREKQPDLLVTTGAEVSLPVVAVAKWFGVPVIYIECSARSTRPSVTGRVLYWVADEFYVQWPELVRLYGSRAKFRGSLIDMDDPVRGDRSRERRMRVTLVQPRGRLCDLPPIEMAYLASSLEQYGCEVRIIDASVEKLPAEEVAAIIRQQRPQLAIINAAPEAQAIARALHALEARPTVVAYGIEDAQDTERPIWDFAVRDEIPECAATILEHVLGDRDTADRTTAVPYPDWSIFPLRHYHSRTRRNDFCLPIVTGIRRGKEAQPRRMEEITDEWQSLVERYGAEEVVVVDAPFVFQTRRTLQLCDALRARGLQRIPWSIDDALPSADLARDLLRTLHDAGCYRIHFRDAKAPHHARAVQLARDAGIDCAGAMTVSVRIRRFATLLRTTGRLILGRRAKPMSGKGVSQAV